MQRAHCTHRLITFSMMGGIGCLERMILCSSKRPTGTAYLKVLSCRSHSPPLSQKGQSSVWLESRNSSTPARASATSGVLVVTTIPSATGSVHAVMSLGIFSTRTRHMRHAPIGSSLGCEQKIGISIPICPAACTTSVPLGTVTDTPSIVSVTLSCGLSLISSS